jgi:hypothetical protein
MMRAIAAALSLALMAGCATGPGTVTRVPVPVACAEPVPERPLMPTDTLAPGVDLFVFTTHAQAEIEVREAYEKRLLLALSECRKPVASP